MLTRTTDSEQQYGYQDYLELSKTTVIVNNKVKEKSGDLFEAPSEYSLAHCLSQDLKMRQGIALMFRRKFGNVKMLQSQRPQLHDVLYIRQENGYILYLITKTKFWQKPSLEDLFITLKNLVRICKELEITKLALPRI